MWKAIHNLTSLSKKASKLSNNAIQLRFASRIREYFQRGDTKLALEQFYSQPNSFDGSFLISKIQNVDEGFKIYQSVAEKKLLEVPIIVSLIAVCSRNCKKEERRVANLWNDLIIVLDKISQQKLNKITSFEWNLIVNGLCRMQRVDKALKFVISDLDNMILTSKTLTAVLNSSCSSGYLEEAVTIFNTMAIKHNVEPDVVHYTCLVKGFSNSKRMNEAMQILYKMEDHGIPPNEITLLTLTTGCIEVADPVLCEKLSQIILNNPNFKQSTKLMTNLIRLLARCGKISDAENCFSYLCANNLENEISFNITIESYGAHKMGQQALQTFYKMISDGHLVSEITLTNILNACIENNLIDEALQIFEWISVISYHP